MKTHNYFVFDYKSQSGKSRAQVVQIGTNLNIKSVIDDFSEIKNTKGEKAKLNIVMFANSQKEANKIVNNWNQTYYNEGRHFDF